MRISKRREVRLEELDVGDAIEVYWLDASEARRPLSLPERGVRYARKVHRHLWWP